MRDEVCVLDVGGYRLAVHQYGDGPRHLLALHGLSGYGFDWLRTAEFLGEGWTVHALDFRGFGASEPDPDLNYSATSFRNDALSVARALDVGKVVLAGHSFGGRVAMLAAAASPELFDSLVVVDSGPIPGPGSAAVRERIGGWPTVYGSATEAIGQFRSLYAKEPEEHFQLRMAGYLRYLPDGRVAVRRDPWWTDVWANRPASPVNEWQSWREVQVPTLLVRGGNSRMLEIEVAQGMIEQNPRASMVEFTGVGHNVPLEAPADLAIAIHDFTEKTFPSATANDEAVTT